MAYAPAGQDLSEYTPRFAGLSGIAILAWIIFGIFRSIDDGRIYFTLAMLVAGFLAAYQLRYSRRVRNPIQGGGAAAFVWIWLAVFSFTRESSNAKFLDYSISLKQLEFLALLPLAFVWIQPYNDERFFGIIETNETDQIHAAWRVSVLMVILINIFRGSAWYWGALEFTILIPMIYETIRLQRIKNDELPVLTLFIQTELSEKFAVPISMMKSVFFIMVVFIFAIIESRFWLLVILGYFGAGMIWAIYSLIPEEQRKKGSQDFDEDRIEEIIEDAIGGSRKKRRERRRERRKREKLEKLQGQDRLPSIKSVEQETKTPVSFEGSPEIDQEIPVEVITQTSDIEKTAIVPINSSKSLTTADGNTIQEKALKFGQQVRSGLEKPYYTLNHILSTLQEEDFSHAWRVSKKRLKFPSSKGPWSPPEGLIIFPIELEKYDYRRSGQILLLGFNKPFDSKRSKFNVETGSRKKKSSGTKITDKSIRFGDVEFNTRSLIVSGQEWEDIRPHLEIVTQDDDISHTGFNTLNHMQEVLASLSYKWMEMRVTAQEAAVNFLAGLLGSTDPIFMPREGLSQPTYKSLEEAQKGKIQEEY